MKWFVLLISKGSTAGALFIGTAVWFGVQELWARCCDNWWAWILLSVLFIYWPAFCFGLPIKQERRPGYLAFLGLIGLAIVILGNLIDACPETMAIVLLFGSCVGRSEASKLFHKEFN